MESEKTNKYLTKEQIETLLKLYYLCKYTNLAKADSMTTSQIRMIEEHALRCIRMSYSKSYMQGKKFDAKTVLQHIADRSGITFAELVSIFDSYIAEGLISKNQLYWKRMKRKDSNPTAIELMNFIFMKYELKILPFSIED